MKKRKWKIEELSPDDLPLERNDLFTLENELRDMVILLNGMWCDDKSWYMYLDGHFIALLWKNINEIVNYDEYREELEIELEE